MRTLSPCAWVITRYDPGPYHVHPRRGRLRDGAARVLPVRGIAGIGGSEQHLLA